MLLGSHHYRRLRAHHEHVGSLEQGLCKAADWCQLYQQVQKDWPNVESDQLVQVVEDMFHHVFGGH